MIGNSLDGIASYVPARVARQLAANDAEPGVPRADRFSGAVLLADITGFTALTESLARRGDVGAEDLTRFLNVYFGQLIDLIVDHGGDIVKFAGDAMLAVWPDDEEDAATSALRAAQCGLSAQERLRDFAADAEVRLSLRISVSAGRLAIIHVGGIEGRRELIATGDPLAQVNAANAEATAGEVVVAAEAWRLVGDRLEGEPLASGAVRVLGVRQPVTMPAVKPAPSTQSKALLPYVPVAAIDEISRGGSSWLAELRRVTVLFVNFPGLTPATPLDRAQTVMRELQTVLYRFEGTINKLSLDDKGASMVAALGLPPLSHEDDPERAVRAAMAIRERLALLQVRHSTGVATGLAFCGIVGNARRREYTMIGDVVNLAARLMQAAKGGILCDRITFESARSRLPFEPLPSIHVKGKAEDIAVFHPSDAAGHAGVRSAGDGDATIGRVREQRAIKSALHRLMEDNEPAVIVFEGIAGIGKSHLIGEVRRRARAAGVVCLHGGGDAMEKSTAFHAWRGIFDDAFGLDPAASQRERHARVAARVAECGRADWTALVPLLNPIMRTAFPLTDAVTNLNDRARASATSELLSSLLFALQQGARCAIVLDDAQWMDSASLALASHIAAGGEPVAMIIATRPIPGAALEEIESLAARPGAARFDLQPLSDAETASVACQRLGVAAVPAAVRAIIESKADGNPLLIQELVDALREAELIHVADGHCRVSAAAGDLQAVDLPTSIQGALTARMDRLSPSQRLLLKFASVAGRVFESDVVRRLCEKHADASTFDADLAALEAARITTLERAGSAPAYAFSHLAFQEISYHLMLFSQRRQLHQSMGELLEERHAADLPAAFPLLAHHWRKAVEGGDADPVLLWKAIDYLHDAGDQALQQFANHEAVEFLNGALALLDTLPESVKRSRKELVLCCAVGAPLLVTRGFAAPETARAYSRASELCQQLENSPEQFAAVYGLWGFAVMSTQLARARTLATELFRLAQAAEDRELLLPAHRAMGDTLFWSAALTRSRMHLEQGMALYRPEHHALEVFRTGQDQGVTCTAMSAWGLWLLGYPDAAMARMEGALALARRLNHLHTISMTMQNYTMARQFRGEPDAVLPLAKAQLALTRAERFPLWEAGALIMRGWARTQLGKVDEGIADMRRGIDGWRATGAELAAPYYFAMLAEAHGRAGRPDAGLEAIAEAIASSDRSGEVWWLAEVWRIEGELRLMQSGAGGEMIERLFLGALALARTQQARSLELRAAGSLLRLWTMRGTPFDQAQQPLADAFAAFTEGHQTRDLQEAARLLRRT
jgi:class 3 adenylate cyclase/predicted ATPase